MIETVAASEWARCRAWIEAALEYDGLIKIGDVEQAIEAGEAHFWPGKHAAMVTQFVEYPRERALCVWFAGGDLEELVNRMRPDVEAWARANGCTKILIEGRRGWIGPLKACGFGSLFTTLCKDITT